MIEIVVGLLCLGAGLGISSGIASPVLQLAGLEFLAGALLASLGAILLAHGLFRHMRDRLDGDHHALRTKGLMVVTMLSFALLIVVVGGVLGQITVSGVPVGFHLMGEVLPLAILASFLAFKRKQAALDRDALDAALSGQEGPHGV